MKFVSNVIERIILNATKIYTNELFKYKDYKVNTFQKIVYYHHLKINYFKDINFLLKQKNHLFFTPF